MKSVIERLQKYCRLSPDERLILVQAWKFFLLAELCLWILPFKHLMILPNKLFSKRCGGSPRELASSIARMAWLVEVAARYAPVNVTCLKKALVLSWLLGRRGIATTLRIGVARREGDLTAHAWLELNGQVILGLPGSNRYAPLFPTG